MKVRRILSVLLIVSIAVLALAVLSARRADDDARRDATSVMASDAPVFAFYYLWWSINHWHDKLGPDYPYDGDPLPLPASLPAGGCPPTSLYAGNQLTDVPTRLWSQDDPGQIEADERQAASAGLTGFAVNWVGSPTYDERLAEAFRAANVLGKEGVSVINPIGEAFDPNTQQLLNEFGKGGEQ